VGKKIEQRLGCTAGAAKSSLFHGTFQEHSALKAVRSSYEIERKAGADFARSAAEPIGASP
jgi:hypothetical protein